jgi:hypothetical protein
MTVREQVVLKIGQLPLDRQLEVLKFIESLEPKPDGPRRDPRGIFAGESFDLSLEDFKEARREMWKNFPREFPQ